MIELQSIRFSYSNRVRVFEDFNWHVKKGEAWTVLGASGCGKSTLLYLLAGLQFPRSGSLLVDNRPLVHPRPRTGLILQDYGLLPWATVEQNVSLGLRLRQFYGPDGKHAPRDDEVIALDERTAAWLERLDLSSIAGQYPGQISGGQRQRTAIARTLALDPDVLLMDEPFSSLDVLTRESLHDIVLELRREKQLTTVIVTHSIDEAVKLGENILVLGKPPNRLPAIVSNPLSPAGSGGQQEPAAYAEFCGVLRRMLEEGA